MIFHTGLRFRIILKRISSGDDDSDVDIDLDTDTDTDENDDNVDDTEEDLKD